MPEAPHACSPAHSHSPEADALGQMIYIVYNRVYNARDLCRRSVCFAAASVPGALQKHAPSGAETQQRGAETEAWGEALSEAAWTLVSAPAFPHRAPEAGPPPTAQGTVGLPGDPGGELPGLLPSDYLGHELGSCWGWILGHRAAPGSSGSSFLVCKPGFSRRGDQLGSAASADGEGSGAKGIINSLTQSFNRRLFGTYQQDL